jgi:hypothetical protein
MTYTLITPNNLNRNTTYFSDEEIEVQSDKVTPWRSFGWQGTALAVELCAVWSPHMSSKQSHSQASPSGSDLDHPFKTFMHTMFEESGK